MEKNGSPEMSPLYRKRVAIELAFWKHKMTKKQSVGNVWAKKIQTKLNNLIPEKVHQAITFAIEKMVKTVLFGAQYTTAPPKVYSSFQLREAYVKRLIDTYKKTASLEGAITGAGGILLGIADFPALLAIKIKMLFDIAATYGFDVRQYKERLFLLTVFQLAFSSHIHRADVYERLLTWDRYARQLPDDINSFDWRTFQLEYRDYIDLAKMAQLIPVIGAAVGAVVNYRLMEQLGVTAMNCYRMRMLDPT
ncbi:ABC transporter-associated protein EcsC [Parapedobacter defluvii]|uniref:ABC transporter-associated protein EcsC n=1 Tax=Parapedobacter defluvii TaxID=2045106 RepID=A0ABQ1LIB0_9SPHI|nr:EcsC family protein [Parapedobacter defluvii]GGC24736.1 ABC transporter-associated protein EcsC [Parapedobacter defluvii]